MLTCQIHTIEEAKQFLLQTLGSKTHRWLETYFSLCERAIDRELEGYFERHHVVPKCIVKNHFMVCLTPEEHYVAHQLLAKMFPTDKRLVSAAILMSKSCPNNKAFGWLRRRYSELRKGKTKENCPSVAKQADQMKGRTKENHDGVARTAEKLTGRTKADYPYLESIGQKNSQNLSGRTKDTHEYIANHSVRMKGRNPSNDEGMAKMVEKLKGRTKDTHEYLRQKSERMKLETKETSERVARMAERQTGQTKETSTRVARMSEAKNILSVEQRRQVVKMRKEGKTFQIIHQWLISEGVKICYSAIPQLYDRCKNDPMFN